MQKKIFISLCLLLIAAFTFAGCTPLEASIEQPSLKYETQYPATMQEYNFLMNKKIVPVLNVLEGHIAKGRDILSGSYPIANEIASVEDSINYLNDIYDGAKVIYPPDSEQQRHADSLMQLKRAINSVEVYYETLSATTDLSNVQQQEDITACINIMQSEYTSLKNMFNTAIS